MVSRSKSGKNLGLKEHLQRFIFLHISENQTRNLSNSRLIFLPLDQAFGVKDYKFQMRVFFSF
jgi:hypothetical protein